MLTKEMHQTLLKWAVTIVTDNPTALTTLKLAVPWATVEMLEWCREHIEYPDEDLEASKQFIKRAAALLRHEQPQMLVPDTYHFLVFAGNADQARQWAIERNIPRSRVQYVSSEHHTRGINWAQTVVIFTGTWRDNRAYTAELLSYVEQLRQDNKGA